MKATCLALAEQAQHLLKKSHQDKMQAVKEEQRSKKGCSKLQKFASYSIHQQGTEDVFGLPL